MRNLSSRHVKRATRLCVVALALAAAGGPMAPAEEQAEIDWAALKAGQSTGVALKAPLAKQIEAIVRAQLRNALGATFCGIKKIPVGYSLRTTLNNHVYEATVHRSFSLWAVKPGELPITAFYVTTKNAWPLEDGVIVPAGVRIEHENNEFWIGKKERMSPADWKKLRAQVRINFRKKEKALLKLLGDISIHDPFSRTKTIYYELKFRWPKDSKYSLDPIEKRVRLVVNKRIRNGKITSFYLIKNDISRLRYPDVTVILDFILQAGRGPALGQVEEKVGKVRKDVRRMEMDKPDVTWYDDAGFLTYGVRQGRVSVIRLEAPCGGRRSSQ